MKKQCENFTRGQRVRVRMGHNRTTFMWYEAIYLYKKELYHYVKLIGNGNSVVGIMNNIEPLV